MIIICIYKNEHTRRDEVRKSLPMRINMNELHIKKVFKKK